MDLSILTKALGEPMRLRIFLSLLERKHCIRSLSKKLGITESAVSQHMKVLREAGLVYGERCGYHVHYFPSQESLDYLASEFTRMREQSAELDRDPNVCNCEFRRSRTEERVRSTVEGAPGGTAREECCRRRWEES